MTMATQASPGVPGYLFSLLLVLLVIIALASLATTLLTLNFDAALDELEAEDYSDVAAVGAVSGDGPKFILEGVACNSKSYVPVMSTVYSGNKHTVTGLAATLSIRNVSETEEFGLTRVDYFDTNGKRLRRYVNDPIRIGPLQTRQYYVDLSDGEGGSGANFIVAWAGNRDTPAPLIDAVMIGGYGTKGISLVTHATAPEQSCE
jgi:uncharacterized protein DUF3124